MKKTLIATAVVSLMPMVATAEVGIYGKANVSLQHSDEAPLSNANGHHADGKQMELVSNASRIGLKGSEALQSGVKIIYQFEYQTEVDDGTNSSGTFSQRNIFVGVQGSAGTLMAGHFDTPTKLVQEKVDLFNDLEGDISAIFKGEIRASNIVQYTTPQWGGGFVGAIAYITEEKQGKAGVSASLGYTGESGYLGVAMDQDVEAEGVDLIRLVGRIRLGALQLGALAEHYDNGVIDNQGVMVSALWSLNDQWALKAQYGDSDIRWAEGKSASLGFDYRLSKNATFYGFYTQMENGVTDLPPPASDNFRDDRYLGVGLDYKF